MQQITKNKVTPNDRQYSHSNQVLYRSLSDMLDFIYLRIQGLELFRAYGPKTFMSCDRCCLNSTSWILQGHMSAIEVDPAIPGIFNEMKLRSTYKWITFKIKDKRTVVVADSRPGDPLLTDDADKAAWNELASSLSDRNPRYILFDMHTTSPEGRKIEKIFFMFW